MKAFVIAGGLPQIELLNQLKARGVTTVLADGNDNALAKPYADIFYHIPIFDIEAVREVAVKEKVDFIITVCADQVLLVVAQVSEMLGLPCYIDYETAQNVSDKLKMKAIFKENDIPTSDFVRLDRFDPDAVSGLRFPLVVKPVDAYSSKGVRRADDLEQLEQFYKEAEEISRSGDVIVESTPVREDYYAVQTPQGFRYKELLQCYEHAAANHITATDDTALAEAIGIEVFLAKGSYSNIKITTPEDIAVAYEIIRTRGELEPFED